MKDARKYLAAWLRDAHAMEGKALTILEVQIISFEEEYPEIAKQLRSRLEEVWDNRLQLARWRRKLGEVTSALDDVTIKINTNLRDFLDCPFGDDLLMKKVFAHNAVERTKAETYRSLTEAAQAAGEPEIAEICDGIVMQGSAMADWMWEQLPLATRERLLA
jgi:ferritin-like metal-binding protein YciE